MMRRVQPLRRRSAMQTAPGALWVAALLAASRLAHAAPEEIQVYVDDLTPTGRFGLDVHNNYVLSGRSVPEYSGEQPPDRVYRFTPEFYYGLSGTLELGMYLLTTISPSGDAHFDGAKLRLKFIPPHDLQHGAFWGLNLEVGKTSLRVNEYPWNLELKGICGWRTQHWLLAANLNIDRSLARDDAATAELDTKVARDVSPSTQLGFEFYSELGRVTDPGPLSAFSQTIYAVVDTELAGFEINAGLGWGLTAAADHAVIKLIVGHRF
jgi:hypothetical protein